MTWKRIVTLARRILQETAASFYSDDILTQYGHLCQKEIADEVIEELATTRSFTSVASTAEYSISTNLGPDFKGIYKLTYDGYVVNSAYEEDWISKATKPGKPSRYGLRGRDTLVFESTPDAAVTVKAWGYRKSPGAVMTLYHDGTTSGVSAVTAGISGTTLTLTATGGTGATTTFDLTDALYSTLALLYAAINALALGYTAALTPEAYSGELSVNLQLFDATNIKGTTIDTYLDPLLGHEYERCLLNGMLAWAFSEKGDEERANKYLKLYQDDIAGKKEYSYRVKRGFKDRSRLDALLMNRGYPLGAGGSVVLP